MVTFILNSFPITKPLTDARFDVAFEKKAKQELSICVLK